MEIAKDRIKDRDEIGTLNCSKITKSASAGEINSVQRFAQGSAATGAGQSRSGGVSRAL
jgi:hypothetical protein